MLRSTVTRAIGGLLTAAALLASACASASDGDAIAALLATVDPATQRELEAYREARAAHEAASQAFWDTVAQKRAERRRKRAAREPITAADYVAGIPPVYAGPQPSKAIQPILAEEAKRDPPKPVLTVADALAAASQIYGFVPERIPEAEFKRLYALEALDVGLSPEQVLRVYALETGGIGTADMQSGVNPITGQGKPISTALGYAQLLHANSVSEIVIHGENFARRLQMMATSPGASPERRGVLLAKARVVRAMLAQAKTVPNKWADHVQFAATPAGIGIHALNLDGDVGPWLQVNKLKGIKALAEREGRPTLTGAELELMNLAGPGTGLEMMGSEAALGASTVNFFSRLGYERNSIVRGRTSAELLTELDRRMDGFMTKPGTVEFAQIFDAVTATRR